MRDAHEENVGGALLYPWLSVCDLQEWLNGSMHLSYRCGNQWCRSASHIVLEYTASQPGRARPRQLPDQYFVRARERPCPATRLARRGPIRRRSGPVRLGPEHQPRLQQAHPFRGQQQPRRVEERVHIKLLPKYIPANSPITDKPAVNNQDEPCLIRHAATSPVCFVVQDGQTQS